MKLYSTQDRAVVALQTLQPDMVKMYTCGPTVYLDPHIGNWRMFIFYDVLARTLMQAGYSLDHVMNITDVGHLVGDGDDGQDKLEKSAKQQNKTAWDVAAHYTDVFLDGMRALNINKPPNLIKATDYIQQQIDLVSKLEANGHTYQISDGVYFDTSTFADYGKMARLNSGGQQEGARVDINTEKRNPQDFALWKLSPKDVKRDMEWESPWGVGFPGWHVECSAMAAAILGPQLDIHAGGIDHIPVHHTNEIAQSEAAFGVQFATIWSHGAFMNVDGKKMSKSLGNIYTLKDLEAKGFESLDFRMLVLQAQYRTHQNFTFDVLEAARNRRRNLQALADMRFQTNMKASDVNFAKQRDQFIAAMQDDINTPEALSVLAEVEKTVDQNNGISSQSAPSFTALFEAVDAHFGLGFMDSQDITSAQKDAISKRDQARKDKDFALSDTIRDQLLSESIELDDGSERTIWRRL